MRKIIIAIASLSVLSSAAFAQTVTAPTTKRGDALRWCGQQWKAEKVSHPDVKGMAAWQSFRKEHCAKGAYAASQKKAELPTTWQDARGKRGSHRHA